MAHVTELTPQMKATMQSVGSWKPNCPVTLDDLRLMRLSYWGPDKHAHMGELVVNAKATSKMAAVFKAIYEAHFPIETMKPVEAYPSQPAGSGASDDDSMAADNTSAFNCRPVTGGGRFSYHAWGLAVDINPVQNPYAKTNSDYKVYPGSVVPPSGDSYVDANPDGTLKVDRSNVRPGMITSGDAVVRAFEKEGATWGGDFLTMQWEGHGTDHRIDYMHFEWTPAQFGIPNGNLGQTGH